MPTIIKKDPQIAPSGVVNFFKKIFFYLKKYPLCLFLLSLGIALGIAYESIIPYVFKWLFNDVLISKDTHELMRVCLIIGICFVLLIVANILSSSNSVKLGTHVINELRYNMFKKMQSISADDGEEDYESNLLLRFSSDIALLENILIQVLPNIVRFGVMSIVGALLLFNFDWQLALLGLFTMVPSFLFQKVYSKRGKHFYLLKKQSEASLLNFVRESIFMQEIVRLLGLKNYFNIRFKNQLSTNDQASYDYSLNASMTSRIAYLAINFGRLMVLLIGAYLVIYDYLSVGSLVGFIMLLGTVTAAVSGLTNAYPTLTRGMESFENIESLLLKETPEVDDAPPNTFVSLKEKITFKDIVLSFQEKEILSNVNLQIEKGQFVAFVGPSGSGKSTLVRLLLKKIKPTSGEVLIDELNLNEISLESFLKKVGVVNQEPRLFDLSIKENIRMGKLDATEEQIMDAAKQAEIHEEIIKFPAQYDTPIKKDRGGLSGGQLQRITLARALVNNPEILVLDEATSALDPLSSTAIDSTLEKMAGSRVILSITHRLRSIMAANVIFVIQQGKIVEIGSHESLSQKGGLYQQLWEKQQGVSFSAEKNQAYVDIKWLKAVPLFHSMNDENLHQLIAQFTMERAEANEVIIHQGDASRKFYIIVAGIVEIRKKDAQGKYQTIAELVDGDFFGEISLLYNIPRTADVKTKGVCIFLTLNQEQFQTVFSGLAPTTQEEIRKIAEARLS